MEENSNNVDQMSDKKCCKKCYIFITIAIITLIVIGFVFIHKYNDDYQGYYTKEEKLDNAIDNIIYPENDEEVLETFLDEDLGDLIEDLEDEDFDF